VAADEEIKKLSIRYPENLWRRLKMLEIDGHIRSINNLTIAAVEKEVRRIERQKEKKEE